MFEARLSQASLLKKIVEAIKVRLINIINAKNADTLLFFFCFFFFGFFFFFFFFFFCGFCFERNWSRRPTSIARMRALHCKQWTRAMSHWWVSCCVPMAGSTFDAIGKREELDVLQLILNICCKDRFRWASISTRCPRFSSVLATTIRSLSRPPMKPIQFNFFLNLRVRFEFIVFWAFFVSFLVWLLKSFFFFFFFFGFFFCALSPEHDKISDFDLKLMEIESDSLGIPETEYKAVVNMPSAELQVSVAIFVLPAIDRFLSSQRICRDLSVLGDTVTIAVTKEGVKFSVSVCAKSTQKRSPPASHSSQQFRVNLAHATSLAAKAKVP
jgi:hypothetical protein